MAIKLCPVQTVCSSVSLHFYTLRVCGGVSEWHMYGKQQQAAISSQSICQLPSLTSANQSAALWVTGQQHSPGVSNRSHSVWRFPCHGAHETDWHPTILSVWCHRVSHQIRPGGQLADRVQRTSGKKGVSGLAMSSSSDFCFFIWHVRHLFTLSHAQTLHTPTASFAPSETFWLSFIFSVHVRRRVKIGLSYILI